MTHQPRFSNHLLLSLLLALAACDGASCAAKDTPTPGVAEGRTDGPCRGAWNACDDPYTTCKRDVCRACGGDGQAACPTYTASTGPCRPGTNWDGGTTCRASCGSPGQPCCKGAAAGYACAGGGSCDTVAGMCVAAAPLCAVGDKIKAITCTLEDDCAMSVVKGFASNSTEAAKACVQAEHGCESVSEDPVETYTFCIHYPSGVTSSIEVDAVDLAGGTECAESRAGLKADGSKVTVTPGACPAT